MAYYRVQLLLTHEQHRKLKQLARVRKTSISALVREFVEKGLQEAAREETDWIERTRRVTQALLEARGGQPINFDPVHFCGKSGRNVAMPSRRGLKSLMINANLALHASSL